jgi:hypothetical protein
MIEGMKPGKSQNYTQQVRVNGLGDPAEPKYSGVLRGVYTYVGNASECTTLECFDAFRQFFPACANSAMATS